jgi:hypothetical protein
MTRRRRKRLLTVAFACAAVGLVLSTMMTRARTAHVPTGASFVGDMESPLSTNFLVVTELGAGAPKRVTGPVRLGSYAAKMTLKPHQERAELQAAPGGDTLKIVPGATAWFADSIDLLPGFPTTTRSSINGWQTLLQWKDAGGTRSVSPPIAVGVRKAQFTLAGGTGCPWRSRAYHLRLAPATTGTWTNFEFQIHFDAAGKGWVDAYVNDHLVIDHYTPPCGTSYPAPYSHYQTLRLGYYRDPAISTPGTVIHDEYRMGATRAEVSLYG